MAFRHTLAAIPLVALVGCSDSAPSLSVIESIVVKRWITCPLVKPANFKRLNGIPGPEYKVMVSYELVWQEAGRAGKTGSFNNPSCSLPMLRQAFGYDKFQEETRFNPPFVIFRLEKGNAVTIDETFTMIKSENGWLEKRR